MDFEIATRRLQKDQQSALARSRAARNARTASAKAKREAQAARAKAERRLKEKKLESERNAQILDKVVRYVRRCETNLGVVNVTGTSSMQVNSSSVQAGVTMDGNLFNKELLANGWRLNPTSIHGEGDKIALPPSILESLTSGALPGVDPWGSGRNGRPLAFRIGVLNPNYAGFPSSDKMKALIEKIRQEAIAKEQASLSKNSIYSHRANVDATNDDMDESDDEAESSPSYAEAYLDELSHRYLSYTHGTVVEFTQEDGCVGLPEPVANALLEPNLYSLINSKSAGESVKIATTRTVDPAFAAVSKEPINGSNQHPAKIDKTDFMDVDNRNNAEGDIEVENTPGHPAYGKFNIPAMPIEITPINSLPPGSGCTLTPTKSSIENGFYGLKNVKLVLEQSLMRTRATLSQGDVIRTWRRGVGFDLIVSKVSPSGYGAVSCVNTDIDVDIGPPEGQENGDKADDTESSGAKMEKSSSPETSSKSMGQGRILSEPPPQTPPVEPLQSPNMTSPRKATTLRPEPPADQTQGVCTIQIRGRNGGSSTTGRRRFDISTTTMSDLFAFAIHVCGEGLGEASTFRLVTRFPRKVYRIRSAQSSNNEEGYFDASATLESVGLSEGQEMFMVEQL